MSTHAPLPSPHPPLAPAVPAVPPQHPSTPAPATAITPPHTPPSPLPLLAPALASPPAVDAKRLPHATTSNAELPSPPPSPVVPLALPKTELVGDGDTLFPPDTHGLRRLPAAQTSPLVDAVPGDPAPLALDSVTPIFPPIPEPLSRASSPMSLSSASDGAPAGVTPDESQRIRDQGTTSQEDAEERRARRVRRWLASQCRLSMFAASTDAPSPSTNNSHETSTRPDSDGGRYVDFDMDRHARESEGGRADSPVLGFASEAPTAAELPHSTRRARGVSSAALAQDVAAQVALERALAEERNRLRAGMVLGPVEQREKPLPAPPASSSSPSPPPVLEHDQYATTDKGQRGPVPPLSVRTSAVLMTQSSTTPTTPSINTARRGPVLQTHTPASSGAGSGSSLGAAIGCADVVGRELERDADEDEARGVRGIEDPPAMEEERETVAPARRTRFRSRSAGGDTLWGPSTQQQPIAQQEEPVARAQYHLPTAMRRSASSQLLVAIAAAGGPDFSGMSANPSPAISRRPSFARLVSAGATVSAITSASHSARASQGQGPSPTTSALSLHSPPAQASPLPPSAPPTRRSRAGSLSATAVLSVASAMPSGAHTPNIGVSTGGVYVAGERNTGGLGPGVRDAVYIDFDSGDVKERLGALLAGGFAEGEEEEDGLINGEEEAEVGMALAGRDAAEEAEAADALCTPPPSARAPGFALAHSASMSVIAAAQPQTQHARHRSARASQASLASSAAAAAAQYGQVYTPGYDGSGSGYGYGYGFAHEGYAEDGERPASQVYVGASPAHSSSGHGRGLSSGTGSAHGHGTVHGNSQGQGHAKTSSRASSARRSAHSGTHQPPPPPPPAAHILHSASLSSVSSTHSHSHSATHSVTHSLTHSRAPSRAPSLGPPMVIPVPVQLRTDTPAVPPARPPPAPPLDFALREIGLRMGGGEEVVGGVGVGFGDEAWDGEDGEWGERKEEREQERDMEERGDEEEEEITEEQMEHIIFLRGLRLEDRMQEFRGVDFPSGLDDGFDAYGGLEPDVPISAPAAAARTSAFIQSLDQGAMVPAEPPLSIDTKVDAPYEDQQGARGAMAPSMSRWSLTSSTMDQADDAAATRAPDGAAKVDKKRKSFGAAFGVGVSNASSGNASNDSPGADDAPTGKEKEKKRNRLASFISRLSGVGVGGSVTSPTAMNSPGTPIPPSPALPSPGFAAAAAAAAGGPVEGPQPHSVPPVPAVPTALLPAAQLLGGAVRKVKSADSVVDGLELTGSINGAWDAQPVQYARVPPSTPMRLKSAPSLSPTLLRHAQSQHSPPLTTSTVRVDDHPVTPSEHAAAAFARKAPSHVVWDAEAVAREQRTTRARALTAGDVLTARRPALHKSVSASVLGPSGAPRPLFSVGGASAGIPARRTPGAIHTRIAYRGPAVVGGGEDSMPPTPSSIASSEIEEAEEEEEEDYGVEDLERGRLRRERAHEERWARLRSGGEGTVTVLPRIPQSPPLGGPSAAQIENTLHVLDPAIVPPGGLDTRQRLKSLPSLVHMRGAPATAGASTANFAMLSPPLPSAGSGKAGKGSGSVFRGLAERMGFSGIGSVGGGALSVGASPMSSVPGTPLSPAPAWLPSASTNASFDALAAQYSGGGGGEDFQPPPSREIGSVFGAGGLLGKKRPKRKLVISGVSLDDERAFEAVKNWCESFGEVREMTRTANGALYVDFKKASVADTVCRVQAQVVIKGVGSVSLSWSTKSKPS